jgi:hypothetical protein
MMLPLTTAMLLDAQAQTDVVALLSQLLLQAAGVPSEDEDRDDHS